MVVVKRACKASAEFSTIYSLTFSKRKRVRKTKSLLPIGSYDDIIAPLLHVRLKQYQKDWIHCNKDLVNIFTT